MLLNQLIERRVALEHRLQDERGDLTEPRARRYDREYLELQKDLAARFREGDEAERIAAMLEMMRVLENRLVYLHNFAVDPSAENRTLAQLVTRFIDRLAEEGSSVLTSLEATYYRAVAALYAGDTAAARARFAAACASEESDEANDIKYKSYVMLGNLAHEERDFAKARELHDQSLRYTPDGNVTAQALALKALNSYALGEIDEALHLFRESLERFDSNQPHFNAYFFRNALLFCGAIAFDRGEFDAARHDYTRALQNAEPHSYDAFDALIHLGRIEYRQRHYARALAAFEKALQTHRFAENELLVDTWFWIARTHLKRGEPDRARGYLEKIAASDVRYANKTQAVELLRRIA